LCCGIFAPGDFPRGSPVFPARSGAVVVQSPPKRSGSIAEPWAVGRLACRQTEGVIHRLERIAFKTHTVRSLPSTRGNVVAYVGRHHGPGMKPDELGCVGWDAADGVSGQAHTVRFQSDCPCEVVSLRHLATMDLSYVSAMLGRAWRETASGGGWTMGCAHLASSFIAGGARRGGSSLTPVTLFSVVASRSRGGRVGDPATWQQEQISLAYLLAVATQANATVASWNVDKDGIDATLKRDHRLVELQMKCTFDPRLLADGTTRTFPLDIATYDKLRGPYRTAPGYLGLVVVPRDVSTWLSHSPESVLIRCAGFYAQIQDGAKAQGSETKTVHLPEAQRLDVAGLDVMFEFAHQRLFGSDEALGEAIA